MQPTADDLLQPNSIYDKYKEEWRFLLDSYIGGDRYRKAGYLTRYQLEKDDEYNARCRNTHLDNHVAGVVGVYNSFVFRDSPVRELGRIAGMVETQYFLDDADLDGRSLDHFLKDAATWASVFGHTWIIMSKPNVNAGTRGDELAQGVRPYVSQLSPLSVLDWDYARLASGAWELSYLRYRESSAGSITVIKEWTASEIKTWHIDSDADTAVLEDTSPNLLRKIPALCMYAQRTDQRGAGRSDVADIARAQQYIYNCNSEIEQSIRLDSHPSLVKTRDTNAGTGAGSIIEIPDNIDPGLVPYALEFSGASVSSIIAAIENVVASIDRMANVGAVRATETRTMSGVAMQTEFQLLNARLADRAYGIELAEEQLWRLFALYQASAFDGSITYPSNFNIFDRKAAIDELAAAYNISDNAELKDKIVEKLLLLYSDDAETTK